jgi:murein DD-endopeptidase MepM/ murein hydrolase activator NlpD
MLIEDYRSNRKRFFGSKVFYVFLILCVCAAGIAAWKAINTTIEGSEEKTTAEQSTIDWSNYTERTVTDDDKNANAPVTGIPDDRDITEDEETQTQETDYNTPYVGKYKMPMGTKILKDYSNGEMVYSKTMGDWRVHSGIDFKGKVGEEVKAIQDGTVIDVSTDEFWGTVVTVKHGNGLTARYCGLSEGSTVKKGNEVGAGDRIGLLGEIPIEIEDGYHLHLDILVNGEIVDPLAAMNKLEN